MKDEERNYYPAFYDTAFKASIASEDNKGMMIEFLNRLLDLHIVDIEYLKNELEEVDLSTRGKRVDVLAKLDNESYILIELNKDGGKENRVRNFNYFASIYNRKTKVGMKYDGETSFILVNLSYRLGLNAPLKEVYQVQSLTGRKYIDNFLIYEFNMDIIQQMWYDKNIKELKKQSALASLVITDFSLVWKDDEFMKELGKKIDDINKSETYRPFLTAEEDIQFQMNTYHESGFREGEELGLKKGEELGLKKGEELGVKKGEELQKNVIIKNMLEKGYSTFEIASIVGVSESEIEDIKK